MRKLKLMALASILLGIHSSCNQPKQETKEPNVQPVQWSHTIDSNDNGKISLMVPKTGRYRIQFIADSAQNGQVWLEDYRNNPDERTYNVTGQMTLVDGQATIDGSPLQEGMHEMKIHLDSGIQLKRIDFELLQEAKTTPKQLIQNMQGDTWDLVWSDEFEGEGLPDTSKWSYNIGNWGWGNNELQYYTALDTKTARQENGTLIIQASKNKDNAFWNSARLTTQGKYAFLQGKIDFRAKVPKGRGTWAAGWLLGDAYKDEISWPYCGEIDVLECVGYEINDSTGNGINHATCHTPAYYFKKGNQIGSEIELDSMDSKFHTYSVEWYPDTIHAYLDGVKFYTYDKTADEMEWPFQQAQNIIINLAIGGGWGGAKGIDSSLQSHQYVLDYVRVYQKK